MTPAIPPSLPRPPAHVGLPLILILAFALSWGSFALAVKPRLNSANRRALMPSVAQLKDAFPGASDAAAFMEAGKPAEAVLALEKAHADAGGGPTSPGHDLLKGILLLEVDQPDAALKALMAARPGLPALQDVVDVHLGAALAEVGNPEQGSAILRAIPRTSPFYTESALQAVELDLSAKATAQALISLGSLIADRPWETLSPDELLLLGRALEAGAGSNNADHLAALRAYQLIDARYPTYRQATIARTHMAAMAQEKGLHPPPLTFDDRYAGARYYQRLHRNETAIEAFTALLQTLPSGDPLYCDAALNLARSYQKQRQYSDSLPWLEAADTQLCDDEDRVVSLYLQGRAYARKGEDKNALRIYAALGSRYPEHTMADDALLLSAAIHQDNDEQAQAEALLRRQLEVYPNGDMASEAAWRLAWAAHNQGRSSEAAATLSRLLAAADDLPSADTLQARYWIAWLGHQSASSKEDREMAVAKLEALAIDAPLSLYGIFAATRLAEVAPDRFDAVKARLVPPAPAAQQAPFDPDAVGGRIQRACLLYSFGLKDLALKVMANREWSELSEEARWHEALAWEAMGQPHKSVWVGRVMIEELGLTAPGLMQRWLVLGFPLPWGDTVERYADDNGFDPRLLMGLMREESNFDPSVRSWAGASGLTQLMWPTAKETARKLGLRITRQSLTNPSTNIRIGARYLGDLLKRFDNRTGLAVPGYNAGAGSVNRWLKERGDLDFDAWVEEIPYKQTRDYVKRVVGCYQTYHYLYRDADESPWVDVPMKLP